MPKIQLFHVDAFASKIFEGNPAGVCPLKEWLEDDKLQKIAAENNLSETAFLVRKDGGYDLRWFAPKCEVNLCGHATLASGFVILHHLEPARDSVRFETKGGSLNVSRDGELLAMDFPALPPWPCEKIPADLLNGLDPKPETVFQIKNNYFVIFSTEEDVRRAQPNFALLEKLHPCGVGITAPGKDCDFVSRYFVPGFGIPEDPVTGSLHCSLVPYWAGVLKKTKLHARQLSSRGGELWCEAKGDRVLLKGKAVMYMEGCISI